MRMKTTLFTLGLVSVAALLHAAEPQAKERGEPPKLTVFMVGDSTMADYPLKTPGPIRGWGQMLPHYFLPNVSIVNHAVCGYTTKASLAHRWPLILPEIRPGDHVIIQFGHNDSKKDKPGYCPAFGTYKENLERFIRETRERQGIPILATSVARRAFDGTGKARDTHGDYPVVTRLVGEERDVPVLDMTELSMELYTRLGPERSAKLFSNPEPGEYPDYKPPGAAAPGDPNPAVDNTHFNALGACRIADLAAAELRTKAPQLARWLRD
jgi:lysophospholipase L1-like esterase